MRPTMIRDKNRVNYIIVKDHALLAALEQVQKLIMSAESDESAHGARRSHRERKLGEDHMPLLNIILLLGDSVSRYNSTMNVGNSRITDFMFVAVSVSDVHPAFSLSYRLCRKN